MFDLKVMRQLVVHNKQGTKTEKKAEEERARVGPSWSCGAAEGEQSKVRCLQGLSVHLGLFAFHLNL